MAEFRKYRLMASQHEQADRDWEPSYQEVQHSRQTGVPLRPPVRKYRAGEIIETDIDLIERFGSEKFQLVDEPSTKKARRGTSPQGPTRTAVAPGGQVQEGQQSCTSLPDGTTVSGLVGDDLRPGMKVAKEEEEGDAAPHKGITQPVGSARPVTGPGESAGTTHTPGREGAAAKPAHEQMRTTKPVQTPHKKDG